MKKFYLRIMNLFRLTSMHVCSDSRQLEIGLTNSCGFGCKLMKCEDCSAVTESHRVLYGCTHPKAV